MSKIYCYNKEQKLSGFILLHRHNRRVLSRYNLFFKGREETCGRLPIYSKIYNDRLLRKFSYKRLWVL